MQTMTSSITLPRAEKKYTFPLILLFIYVLVEYGKPKVLDPLHPGIILQALLGMFMIKNHANLAGIFKDGFFKLFIALIMEMVILGFLAENNHYALNIFIGMTVSMIFSIAICVFVNNAERLRAFLAVYVSVFALIAINQFLTGRKYFGNSGVLGDLNDFALAMNVVMPICFYLSLSYVGIKKTAFRLSTILFVLANVSTLSRGGFLGMAAVALLYWFKTKSKARALVILLFVIIVFIIVVPFIPSTSEIVSSSSQKHSYKTTTYFEEIISIKDQGAQTGTGRERFELWKVAWRVFLDNPLLGIGQGNLPFRIQEYQYDESGNSYWHRAMWAKAVHSVYFTLLAELGIVGIIIWVLMIRNILRKYRTVMAAHKEELKPTKNEELQFLKNCMAGFFLALVGYLVSGAFLSAFYYPHFWTLSALMTATYMITRRMEKTDQAELVDQSSKSISSASR